jgi:hypothetical protein
MPAISNGDRSWNGGRDWSPFQLNRLAHITDARIHDEATLRGPCREIIQDLRWSIRERSAGDGRRTHDAVHDPT